MNIPRMCQPSPVHKATAPGIVRTRTVHCTHHSPPQHPHTRCLPIPWFQATTNLLCVSTYWFIVDIPAR